MVLRTLSKDYPDIKTAGYKITLSIDLPTQKIAQDSLKWGYDRLKDKYELNTTSLNGAIVTIDSKTGDVLSAVGGVNYAKSSFNRVDQAMRSIGSAIKPFVYQQALDKGYNPATPIPDVARTYHIKGKTPRQNRYWRPKNYENDTLGFISLRMALVHSRNLATINLAQALGLENVIDGLYKFGFDKMPKDMSIVLGSFAVSPLKMAEEYTIFSNYGVKVKPRLILSLENKDKGLKVDFPVQKEKLIPNYQAYLMISILQDVVKKGTGVHARMKNIQVAGKTGTTNDYKDGWWCGFTPDTTTIVWFGRDDNTPIGRGMAGGKTSAPVFKHFYTDFLKIHPERRRRFVRPRGVRYFYYEDKKELYTKMSPPPPPKKQVSVPIF
jgi:penicillin-binding protein 1A